MPTIRPCCGLMLTLSAAALCLLAPACGDSTTGTGTDATRLDTGYDAPDAALDASDGADEGDMGVGDATIDGSTDGADDTGPEDAATDPGDAGDADTSPADTSEDVATDAGSDATEDAAGDADTAGDTGEDAVADTPSDPDGGGFDIPDVSGPALTIVIEGSLEDRAPDDGLAAQTPDPYLYGLQRLELLRDATDASPAVIFDYDPGFVWVDMHERTVAAVVAIDSLPEGTFNYFRILLTALDADVEATLHNVPSLGTWATTLNVVYALSDTTIDGEAMEQGDALVTAHVPGPDPTFPYHADPDYPEPSPAAWAESIDGNTFVTFLLDPPLVVSPDSPADHTYVIRYFIKDSFRWEDLTVDGFTDGEWDIDLGENGVEPIRRFGANDYEVVEE